MCRSCLIAKTKDNDDDDRTTTSLFLFSSSVPTRKVVCQDVLLLLLLLLFLFSSVVVVVVDVLFSSPNSIISLIESTGCPDKSETENDTSSSSSSKEERPTKTNRCHSSIRLIFSSLSLPKQPSVSSARLAPPQFSTPRDDMTIETSLTDYFFGFFLSRSVERQMNITEQRFSPT